MIGYIAGSGWPKATGVIQAYRHHYYETEDMAQVRLPVEELKAQGCDTVLLTASVGALSTRRRIGTVYAVKDTMTLFCPPLYQGSVFTDLSGIFEPLEGFDKVNHAFVAGPNYETPLDKQILKQLGADVVGMSITPEAICAKELGMKVYALVVVTNGPFEEHSHTSVLEAAHRADLQTAIDKVLAQL